MVKNVFGGLVTTKNVLSRDWDPGSLQEVVSIGTPYDSPHDNTVYPYPTLSTQDHMTPHDNTVYPYLTVSEGLNKNVTFSNHNTKSRFTLKCLLLVT